MSRTPRLSAACVHASQGDEAEERAPGEHADWSRMMSRRVPFKPTPAHPPPPTLPDAGRLKETALPFFWVPSQFDLAKNDFHVI